MGKVLRSGTVYMGTCGDPSGLTDSFGCDLYVGDLVDVYSETAVKKGFERDAAGPEYIVRPDGEDAFIMGLKSTLCWKTEYYLDGREADESCYDYMETYFVYNRYPEYDPGYRWLVKKVKSYKDTVHGERWGSGNVTTYLETGDEQDKQNEIHKEVF